MPNELPRFINSEISFPRVTGPSSADARPAPSGGCRNAATHVGIPAFGGVRLVSHAAKMRVNSVGRRSYCEPGLTLGKLYESPTGLQPQGRPGRGAGAQLGETEAWAAPASSGSRTRHLDSASTAPGSRRDWRVPRDQAWQNASPSLHCVALPFALRISGSLNFSWHHSLKASQPRMRATGFVSGRLASAFRRRLAGFNIGRDAGIWSNQCCGTDGGCGIRSGTASVWARRAGMACLTGPAGSYRTNTGRHLAASGMKFIFVMPSRYTRTGTPMPEAPRLYRPRRQHASRLQVLRCAAPTRLALSQTFPVQHLGRSIASDLHGTSDSVRGLATATTCGNLLVLEGDIGFRLTRHRAS